MDSLPIASERRTAAWNPGLNRTIVMNNLIGRSSDGTGIEPGKRLLVAPAGKCDCVRTGAWLCLIRSFETACQKHKCIDSDMQHPPPPRYYYSHATEICVVSHKKTCGPGQGCCLDFSRNCCYPSVACRPYLYCISVASGIQDNLICILSSRKKKDFQH